MWGWRRRDEARVTPGGVLGGSPRWRWSLQEAQGWGRIGVCPGSELRGARAEVDAAVKFREKV